MSKKAGERVDTCEEMYALALAKKSVYVRSWKKPCAAAFFSSWQMIMLINWLKRGEFTVYEAPKKPTDKWYNSKGLTELKKYPWTPITAGRK